MLRSGKNFREAMENQQNHDIRDTLAKILDALSKFQVNQEIVNEEFRLRLDALRHVPVKGDLLEIIIGMRVCMVALF